jgi:hypothetical protein
MVKKIVDLNFGIKVNIKMIKNLIFTKFKKYVIVLNVYARARGSVDRATGSGPVGRGFKSLRAHFIYQPNHKGLCLLE